MALTTTQIEELQALLLQQKEKLEDVMSSLAAGDPTRSTARSTDNADVGTEASESTEIIAHESLERETQILLERTTNALMRIEAGTYGTTDSGEDIPYERLLIDPTATTTIQHMQ